MIVDDISNSILYFKLTSVGMVIVAAPFEHVCS